MHSHGRTRLLAGALVLAFAALAPATANAAHDLRIKKQEKHFTLDSDEETVGVSCDAGYRVTDGMWRIDHADQDDDVSDDENYVTAVDVLEAYSDTPTSYTFRFVKNSIGRAQGKVFVTCVGTGTEGDENHTMAPTFEDGPGGVVALAGTSDTGTGQLDGETATAPDRCDPKWIVIAPGFKLTTASERPGVGRMIESGLADTTSGSANRDWEWKVAAGPDTATLETSFRCLKLRVDQLGSGTAPAGHRHKIIKKTRSSTPSIAPGVQKPKVHCGDAYKAVVAGFSIDPLLVDPLLAPYEDGTWDLWYLGMDPRPKTRAYRFFNQTIATINNGVTLAATCLNYRTT